VHLLRCLGPEPTISTINRDPHTGQVFAARVVAIVMVADSINFLVGLGLSVLYIACAEGPAVRDTVFADNVLCLDLIILGPDPPQPPHATMISLI
jgi:hypothetical protein